MLLPINSSLVPEPYSVRSPPAQRRHPAARRVVSTRLHAILDVLRSHRVHHAATVLARRRRRRREVFEELRQRVSECRRRKARVDHATSLDNFTRAPCHKNRPAVAARRHWLPRRASRRTASARHIHPRASRVSKGARRMSLPAARMLRDARYAAGECRCGQPRSSSTYERRQRGDGESGGGRRQPLAERRKPVAERARSSKDARARQATSLQRECKPRAEGARRGALDESPRR